MQAGKAIGLVATFVIGVVLVMGAALIYLLANEPKQEHAPIDQRLPQPLRLPAPRTQTASSEPQTDAQPVSSPVSSDESEFEAYSPAASAAAGRGHRTGHIASSHSSATTRHNLPNPALSTTITSSGVPRAVDSPTIDADTLLHPPIDTQENNVLALAAQPHKVTLPVGAPLAVKLTQPLSTDEAKPGQFFQATLASPIVRDGFVLAETGSRVTGEVVRSRRAGVFGRAPELRLTVLDIRTSDRQVARVQTTIWDDTGRSHNLIAGTFHSAMGAVKGAVQGAARGSGVLSEPNNGTGRERTIFVPANTILEFRLVAPLSVTERVHQ